MVGVWIMDMSVPQANMRVAMAVRFTRWVTRRMAMPVMLVVDVFVGMCHGFVFMLVLMPLSEVQPNTERHEDGSDKELNGDRLIEEADGKNGSYERCRRVVRPRPSGSYFPKGEHEKDKT